MLDIRMSTSKIIKVSAEILGTSTATKRTRCAARCVAFGITVPCVALRALVSQFHFGDPQEPRRLELFTVLGVAYGAPPRLYIALDLFAPV